MASNAGLPNESSSGRTPGRKREQREMVRIGAAVVALILLIAFVLDNSQTVKVGFVLFSRQISLIWVLLIAAILGALVDRLVILLRRRRKKAASGNPTSR
jgi:uncharacterized integral membrane protein